MNSSATSKRRRKRRELAIIDRAVSTLHNLLEFKTVYDIQAYMTDKNSRNFRQFEDETAEQIFAGAGVLADRANVIFVDEYGDTGFYRTDVPMGSHETGAYIGGFPLEAASASYVFTLIEGFGDEVADLVSPGSRDRNKAWHEDIKGFADLRDPVQVESARKGFARHLAADPTEVPEIAARRMVGLKAARNAFAHDGNQSIDFELFLQDALAIVCHVAFLVTDADRLSAYPWEDHDNYYEPQTGHPHFRWPGASS